MNPRSADKFARCPTLPLYLFTITMRLLSSLNIEYIVFASTIDTHRYHCPCPMSMTSLTISFFFGPLFVVCALTIGRQKKRNREDNRKIEMRNASMPRHSNMIFFHDCVFYVHCFVWRLHSLFFRFLHCLALSVPHTKTHNIQKR